MDTSTPLRTQRPLQPVTRPMSTLEKKVDLRFIRYANCWEDAGLLTEAFAPLGKNARFLSVASAGDNSLMLLTLDPSLVVAADLNPAQLHLTALKAAAIARFDRNTTLAFLGFTDCANRSALYRGLRALLTAETDRFWQSNMQMVEQGVIHSGKFEKYFRFFSSRILPFIHSRKKVKQLLAVKSPREQHDFYHTTWDRFRWRLFFRVFFSKYVMGKYGRDPEFMRQVKINVPRYIYNRAASALSRVNAQQNFMLHYQLTGHFGSILPDYMQEKNYDRIKNNIGRLEIFRGSVNDAARHYGRFEGMNLSNVFEYMPAQDFSEASASLLAHLEKNGLACYWNLMVHRSMAETCPGMAVHLERKSQQLSREDRGFFYHRFMIDQRS